MCKIYDFDSLHKLNTDRLKFQGFVLMGSNLTPLRRKSLEITYILKIFAIYKINFYKQSYIC